MDYSIFFFRHGEHLKQITIGAERISESHAPLPLQPKSIAPLLIFEMEYGKYSYLLTDLMIKYICEHDNHYHYLKYIQLSNI